MDLDLFRRGWSTPLVTVPRSLALPDWLEDRTADFLRRIGLPRFLTWRDGTQPKIELSFDRIDHRITTVRGEASEFFEVPREIADALILGDWSFDGGAHLWWCLEPRLQRVVGIDPERDGAPTPLVASSVEKLAELLLAFRDWGRANTGRVGDWAGIANRLRSIDPILDENSEWLGYIRYAQSQHARIDWPIDDQPQ